jgi:hypothetical protein
VGERLLAGKRRCPRECSLSTPDLVIREGDHGCLFRGIKTSSYRQARVSAVRSVKRPSPGCTVTGKKRRLHPFAGAYNNRQARHYRISS